eukprot:340722-Amphidinium_carterae.1
MLPLHVAAGSDNADAVRLLVKAGASVDKKSRQHKKNGEKMDDFTALHEAAYFGNLESTRALLDERADPNAKNLNEQTALHVVLRAWNGQVTEVVRMLLESKADVTLRDYTFRYKKKPEWTWIGGPLHLACVQPESSEVAEMLLDMKAEVNEYTKCKGSTVTMLLHLHVAAGSDNADVVRLLVKARAAVGQKSLHETEDTEHFTALHEAAYFGNLASTQALLEEGADPNARDMHEQTALHVLVRACNG